MVKQQDLTVSQTLAELQDLARRLRMLQESIILRAQLQEVTELQYNALVQLAREGVEFLQDCQSGDVITNEWIAKRNDLVRRAQLLIQDAP